MIAKNVNGELVMMKVVSLEEYKAQKERPKSMEELMSQARIEAGKIQKAIDENEIDIDDLKPEDIPKIIEEDEIETSIITGMW